jgi:hypothetical protein
MKNMDLNKILAESMLRFGVKNLSAASKQRLIEQAEPISQDIASTTTNSTAKSTNPNAVSQSIDNTNPDRYCPSIPNFKILGKVALDQRILNINNPKQKANYSDKSVTIEAELKSLPNYDKFITHLSNQDGTPITWFLKLNQASRKDFIAKFTTQLATIDPKLEYSIIIKKGKITTTVTPIDATIVPPVSVGINISGPTVFVDNKSDITSDIQTAIDAFILDIEVNQQQLIGTDVKLQVTQFEIGASASRLRNTGKASDLTWSQLSSARAAKVTNEISTRLAKLGISIPNNVITIKGGTNGDGTSGPNPPENYTYSIDGTANNVITDIAAKQNAFPKLPISNDIMSYNQYKWLVVSCVLSGFTKSDIPNKEIAISGEYSMAIKQFDAPGSKVMPKPNRPIPPLKTSNKEKSGKRTLDLCPDFDNVDKNAFWNNLNQR